MLKAREGLAVRILFSASAAFLSGCLFCAAAPAGADMPADARALTAAYPDAGMVLVQRGDGLYIRFGRQTLLFSPAAGCPEVKPEMWPETWPENLADPPLCVLFAQAYPSGSGGRFPQPGFDPGRIRNEALLRLLYGRDSKSVADNCVTVSFLGERLLFNKRHGAARALSRVAARLEELARDPDVRDWLRPVAGTFSWRKIKASSRLSAHSFGIAIDLNKDRGLYWLWHPSPAAVERVRCEYPQAILDAFESEGFIWGGKWHSFDFMHFEYRPELHVPASK